MFNTTLDLQKYKLCLTELEIEGIFLANYLDKANLIFEVSGRNLHSQQGLNFDSSVLMIIAKHLSIDYFCNIKENFCLITLMSHLLTQCFESLNFCFH